MFLPLQVRYVACKRFHPQRDTSRDESHRELSNLQVLKESITSHANIRLHLAIIFHKSEHFIILPWAEHLDLEIFLLEGHDFRGGTIYDFNLRFPGVQPGGMVAAVCKQMHHVADALRWLHNGIITQGKQQSKICFAHMDLKPNNILIDKGSSPVGRWVLTDFGISAFKEDEGSEPNNFVSIRDYYQNLTINTQPRRDPGAYQPPEVENTGNNVLEGRITAKEGHAGRRGDIWSFGCILAEVLVFALGQTPLVKQFRKHRKGPKEKHYSTDYFYEEIPSETLRPNATGKHYRVRPWIEDFLRRLSDTYTPLPNNTINCCVETILEILVTDGDHRPNADLLLDKLSHVEKHVSTAMFSGETPSNCPWKRRSKRPERPTNHLKEGESVGREDSMTNGAYAIDPWESHLSGQSPERLDSHQQNTPRPPFQPPGTPNERLDQVSCNHDKLTIPSPPIANLSASSAEVPVLDNPSVPAIMRTNTTEIENLFAHSGPFRNESHSIAKSAFGLGISSYPEGQSPAPESLQSHNIDRRLSKESRRGLHGVLIDQERLRRVQPSVEIVLSGLAKRKLIGFSICPSGRRVAHLTELKSKYEVSMSQLSLDMRREGEQHLVPLPDGITWQGIQIASNYVVARGLTPNGAKQVSILKFIVKENYLSFLLRFTSRIPPLARFGLDHNRHR
jgi:serine/threonine protein kinase